MLECLECSLSACVAVSALCECLLRCKCYSRLSA